MILKVLVDATIYIRPIGGRIMVGWLMTEHSTPSIWTSVSNSQLDSVGIHCPMPYAQITVGEYDEGRTIVEAMFR